MQRNFSGMFGLVLLLALCRFVGAQDVQQAKDLVAQAQTLAKGGKLEEAITLMKKAVELAPRNDLFLAITSDYEMKAGRFAEGLEHILQAIKLNDRDGNYFVLAAANAYGAQDFERARAYVEHVLKGGAKLYGPGAVKDALFVKDLLVEKTYTLFFNLEPQRGRSVGGTFTIALPKTGLPNQKATYEINGVKSQRFARGDVNDLLYVVPQGTKPFPLTIKVTTQPYSFKKDLTRPQPKTLSAEVRAYLGAQLGVDPKSPVLKKVVTEVKSAEPVVTVRNIQAWLKKNIEYKLDRKSIVELDFKSVDEIVKRGHAECRGYALLFTGLCRAADIPTRVIWGMFRVPPGLDRSSGDIVSHNWAEVYLGGSWIPVDPQRPETLGNLPTNYLRIFVDMQKTKTSTEGLPLLNLILMHNGPLRFEEEAR